ncbi:hypothetical protein ABFV05_010669 [Capra hircus]
MEHVTCKVHLQHLRIATPPELLSWLVSLLVKGVTARGGAVMEMRGIAQVSLLWCQSQPGRPKLTLRHKPMRKDPTGWLQSHCGPKDRDGPKDAPRALQSTLGNPTPDCAFEEHGQDGSIGTMGEPNSAPTLCHSGPKALQSSEET